MPRDIEQLIRTSLAERADEARPDPATWSRVQRRIRRKQSLRWALAGVTAAAAIAAAAVVLPQVLGGSRVDLSPADEPTAPTEPAGTPTGAPTTQPQPSPTTGDQAIALPAEGLVLVRDDAIVIELPGQAPFTLIDDAGPLEGLAVRPGSTADDLTLAFARDDQVTLATSAGDQMGQAPLPIGGREPVWSPDGRHLAWLSGEGADLAVNVATWPAPPGAGAPVQETATFGLDASLWSQVRLNDWVWTEGMETVTAGFLRFTLMEGDLARALDVPFERQGDGAIATSASALAFDPDPDAPEGDSYPVAIIDSHHNDGAAVGPEYALVVDSTGSVWVERSGDADGSTAVEVTDLVDAGQAARAWLSARGDVAILGDGVGGAWVLVWNAEGFTSPVPLAGGVTDAAVVNPTGNAAGQPVPAEPTVQPEEPPGEDPGADLPDPVADTRQAIIEASRAGDVAALAALTGPRFSAGFGNQTPEELFTQLRAEGRLDLIARMLELPPTTTADPELVIWPFAWDRSGESLSSAERTALLAIAEDETELDSWFTPEGYLGPRTGIETDGTWRFLVLGGD